MNVKKGVERKVKRVLVWDNWQHLSATSNEILTIDGLLDNLAWSYYSRKTSE